ncbi:hypothetical protein [Staphylothermus hellenicus]
MDGLSWGDDRTIWGGEIILFNIELINMIISGWVI